LDIIQSNNKNFFHVLEIKKDSFEEICRFDQNYNPIIIKHVKEIKRDEVINNSYNKNKDNNEYWSQPYLTLLVKCGAILYNEEKCYMFIMKKNDIYSYI